MESKFLLEISIILVSAKIFGLFSRKFHMPHVVGALIAGILLGPAVFNILEKTEMITKLAEIGVLLLMFSAGMETDFNRLRNSLKSSLVIAVIGVVVPLVSGFAIAMLFGQDVLRSIFIGLILTATSISITVEVLHEMDKLKTKAGTAILGAAVIDDIIGVILLSILIGVKNDGVSSAEFGLIFLRIFGFLVFAVIGSIIMRKLFDALSNKIGNKKRLPIFGLGLCFFMAYLAELYGIAGITGAYLAGLVFCSNKAEKYIERRNDILSYMFFAPIFFISVGLMASFEGLTGETILFGIFLFVAAILSKLFGCGLGAFLCKFSKKESFQVGAGMISRGEIAIILATKGMISGLLDAHFLSVIIIVVVLTTLIAPIFIKFSFSEKEIPSSV